MSATAPAATAPVTATAGAAFPPWLVEHWQHLWESHTRGRLGHAWLLSGISGLGKRLFADRFAQALLCQNPGPDGLPCAQCEDCHLIVGGNHPDLQRIGPDAESASGEIKVAAIRELVGLENLTSHRGRHKIIQIVPAEAMNRAAANSLLKTLEEPTRATLLLLIATDVTRLPATIRSRCQQLMLVPPPESVALPWLQARLAAQAESPIQSSAQSSPQAPAPAAPELLLRLAQGAPLRALTLAQAEYLGLRQQSFQQFLAVAEGRQDPLAIAQAWQALDVPLVLETVLGWLCDLARLASDPRTAYLSNPDLRETLQALAARVPPVRLHEFLRQMMRARTLVQSSVNKQLLLESLLIRWSLLTAAAATAAGRN
ncbi:DNA polymerase III subunit delta' [Rhabdochromatium marinum]|uniref:DNA polymerase III subunit delta' n=1 Tax=Rhabdochromatium marinum TaxID=48729 RepID=UPI0019038466|nr:DNA polymerase III subunit delta' [Rhabdochromatium marinum]MBK1649095.1 DNA polymerase III subunit delta' [Rhabdochromatium marinum]